MGSIRSLLAKWDLSLDTSVFLERQIPFPCDERCSHGIVKHFEDIFDFDISSFGPNCKIIAYDYEDLLDKLFSAAVSISLTEEEFERDLLGASISLADPFPDLPVFGLQGENFYDHALEMIKRYIRVDLDAAFRVFKKACGADESIEYDSPTDMVYVKVVRGWGWLEPVAIVGELYEVIKTKSLPDLIFKIPLWALSHMESVSEHDRVRTWASNPAFAKYRENVTLFTKFPVESFTLVEPGDDEVFMETFKVLVLEMSVPDAAKAARALR